MRALKPHEQIRVTDWPGTRGKVFTVLRHDVERRVVHAHDLDFRTRSFPQDLCRRVRAKAGEVA
jgi:hypothetical protein